MTIARAAAALLLIAGCPRSPTSSASGPRDARGQDDAAMIAHAEPSSSELTITVTTELARRPPMVELAVDVRAHNPSAAPRWYLVPRDVDQPIGGGGVDVVELVRWGDDATGLTVGAFQGTGGFFAIWLAPGATVELRGLGVRWFRDDDGARPPIETVTASTLTVGGRPAEAWFPTSPLVTGERRGERGEIRGSVRFQPDSREVAVELGEATRHATR